MRLDHLQNLLTKITRKFTNLLANMGLRGHSNQQVCLLAENISGDALPEADGTKDLFKSRVSIHEGLSPLTA